MRLARFIQQQVRTYPIVTTASLATVFVMSLFYGWLILKMFEAGNCRTIECDTYVAPGTPVTTTEAASVIVGALTLTTLTALCVGAYTGVAWLWIRHNRKTAK